MTQSSETLAAAEAGKGGNLKKSGFYISKVAAILAVVSVVGALVAVGLLVYYLAPPRQVQTEDGAKTSTLFTSSSTQRPATTTTQTPVVDTDVRLPRSVQPVHYAIQLLPHFENFTIDGSVEILVKCEESTTNVTLHSIDIDINKPTVKIVDVAANANLMVHGITADIKREFIIIQLHQGQLTKGKNYKISMEFTAYLNDELRGFYRSSYEEGGQKKWLATTQFQATDARRAFPCFDEPNMKAEFTITLGRKESMTSLSNTLTERTENIAGKPGYVWDHYKKTVPMSTYLVAFVVSEFEKVVASSSNPLFRVWARPSAISQASYAADIGPRILHFFEEYFNISYPLEKQDMIAIPDFSAGAMENWGLITYRETAALYDPKISGAANKQRVAVVVSHELAHQWFGNLVTLDWWSDLWLNEGFASYVEYLGVQKVEPDWGMEHQFLVEDLQDVFSVDALESSHPIYIPVQHPDQINEIFDRISYAKGASIIRMLNGILGEETFKRGLTRYLTSRKYGNAVQDDLWKSLYDQAVEDQVSLPVSVKAIMDTWTLKMGFPVITVERNYRAGTAQLQQKRFLLSRSANSTDTTVYRWWVPLTYTKDFSTVQKDWLSENSTSKSLTLQGTAANQWVIFNVDEVGYYRVNYDQQNWRLIHQQLLTDLSKININNRAQIMDDSINLARAGELHYHIALNLTEYLKKETHFLPWDSALTALNFIDSMLQRTPEYGRFKNYMKDIIQPLFDAVGFQESSSDPHLTIYSRINALSWTCSLGMKDCVGNATKLYAEWIKDTSNPDVISPNLKRVVSCTAIREGSEEEWNAAFERYKTTNVATERDALLSAMTCSGEPWILSRMLEWSLDSSSGIRKQDASSLFRGVSLNPLGRYIAFNFLRVRWSQIKNYFTGIMALGRVVESLTASFNTPLEVDQLKQFKMDHIDELGSATRAIDQSIEQAEANVQWMERYYTTVSDWLAKYQ